LVEADNGSITAQRLIAIKHGSARNTVARKIAFLAERVRAKTENWLASQAPFTDIQWDELINIRVNASEASVIGVNGLSVALLHTGLSCRKIPGLWPDSLAFKRKNGPGRNLSGYADRHLYSLPQ